MSYNIDARLNGRNPRLEIHDAESGAVRMIWEYRRSDEALEGQLADDAALKELFRQLFLLTTRDYLKRR